MLQLAKKWNAIVMDPTTPKKNHKIFGHCVPIFKGVREYTGTAQGYKQSHENGRSVKDVGGLEQMKGELDETMQKATVQFATTPGICSRSAELQSALAPAHLAQGIVDARARSTFFDQLVYEELKDIELVEAQREAAFQKDLKEAEDYVREQGLSDGSGPAKSSTEMKILQLRSLLKISKSKMQAAHDACEETNEHVVAFVHREIGEEDSELKKQLEEALDTADKNNGPASASIIRKLDEIKVGEQEHDEVKAQIKAILDEHRGIMRTWKKTIAAVEKEMNKCVHAPKEKPKDQKGQQDFAQQGRFLHSNTLVEKQQVNCSQNATGMFSRDCGAREAIGKDIVIELNGMSFVKGALKMCWKHIEESDGSSYATSLVQNLKHKALAIESLKKGGVSSCFHDIAFHPRDMAWASCIFGLQAWACTSAYSYHGANPFAVAEGRLVTSGSLVVGGAPVAAFPGATYAEKIAFFEKASGQDLDALVQKHGWACRLGSGDIVLVPVGHIAVMVPTSEKVEGLRWGFCRPDDEAMVLRNVSALLDTYPPLRTTSYNNWLNFLSERVNGTSAGAAPRTPAYGAAPATPAM